MKLNLLSKLIIFVTMIACSEIFSQPVISYITPDIGAPGMAIYIEIIGPHDKKNNFGNDGIYTLQSERVKIIFDDPNASDTITVGPIVVSWEGRMLSTVFYINEFLKPNSENALLASPQFQFPFKIKVDNDLSNPANFYVVKSRPYLDLTSFTSDSIFGEGNIGLRSPRGAMIFDSLKLGQKIYRISIKDCDSNTDGNQAYLPFILLVKGKIEGIAGKSKISANGGDNLNGMIQDASAGGGGGGGSFRDAGFSTDLGFRGGNGFTGGGPGGRNKNGIPFVSDEYTKPPSSGSGPYLAIDDKSGGYSLNAISGAKLGAYEAAGGATGHPFGKSGEPCGDGNGCEPTGGYGAGSGYKQNNTGGSGGYATDGVGSLNNGGKSHGNIMVIPIAGGSGGAGGNPQCLPPGMSGAGGAGGGAMRIFAQEIKNVTFTANGANGADNGCENSWGGSGSGGHVGTQAKLGIFNSIISVDGGINAKTIGGTGRVRNDAPQSINLNISTANASIYNGPTTDTSSVIRSNHILTGSQGIGQHSHLYGMAPNKNWTLIGNLDTENWSFDLSSFLDGAGTYYICVATEVGNPKITDFSCEPHYVLSQAACNYLKLDLRAYFRGDSVVKAKAIYCIGDTITLKAKISNDAIAEASLDINLAENWLLGNNGFTLLGPKGKYSIAPGDTAEIVVQFVLPTGADPSQFQRNYLIIPSNDVDFSPGKDWKIEFEVAPSYSPELSYQTNQLPPYTFKDTRVGQSDSLEFDLINSGNSKLWVSGINPLPVPFELISTNPTLPALLEIGDILTVNVKFSPVAVGDFDGIITAIAAKTDSSCALESHTQILGKGVLSEIIINKYIVDYGLIPYCKDSIDIIKISNPANSTSSFQITSKPVISGPNANLFTIIKSPTDNTPVITPGDGVQYEILFTPDISITGPIIATFYFTTDDPNNPEVTIQLIAEIVAFNMLSNPVTVNLGNFPVGFDAKGSFDLTNYAKLDNVMSSIKSASGNVLFTPLSDSIVLANLGTKVIEFIVNLNKAGNYKDTIFVVFNEPCLDSIKVIISGNALLSNPTVYLDKDIIISNLDTTELRETNYGEYPICASFGLLKSVEYVNNSGAHYIVLDEQLISNPSLRFSIDNTALTYPDTIFVKKNRFGAQIYFDPVGAPTGNYDAVLNTKLYLNGKIYNYEINLKAIIYRGRFTITPEPVIINAVVNSNSQTSFKFTNDGPEQIELKTHLGPFNNSIFSITPNPDNITLLAGDSQDFIITFTPLELIQYQDSIIFNFVCSNCDTSYTLAIIGNAEPSKELTIYINDLILNPDLKNYKLPIYGKFKLPEDSLSKLTVTFDLSFNRSLFYPISVDGGTINSNQLNGNSRELNLSFDGFNISNKDTVIGFITGHTLLGDETSTLMKISNPVVVQKELISSVDSKDGSLTIQICEEGGSRLLNNTYRPFSVNISPNPANETINIKITTLEKGPHAIILSDLNGELIWTENWNTSAGSEKDFVYQTDNIASGVYMIKVLSPNDIKQVLINVIK